MRTKISGIQQIGIGVENIEESWEWYKKYFGMDVCIFEEKAVAEFMLHYTEGKPRERHALLAVNMQGGGGFEIWQHTGKTPQPPLTPLQFGELGINVCKIKTPDAQTAYDTFARQQLNLLTPVMQTPDGHKQFYLSDPFGNIFQFIEHPYVFMKTKSVNGGVFGAIIGTTDIEKSLEVYQDILQYDEIVYDLSGRFDDFSNLNAGNVEFRRVLLKHSEDRKGAFAKLFGPTQIELIQAQQGEYRSVFHDRIWGDPGFIHICFDINGFEFLKKECSSKGYPFTVDSTKSLDKAFDMGSAAGNFSYISDPDGTPIEFVETKKVPVLKKLGIFIRLDRRNPEKSLPVWLLRALRFQKRKS